MGRHSSTCSIALLLLACAGLHSGRLFLSPPGSLRSYLLSPPKLRSWLYFFSCPWPSTSGAPFLSSLLAFTLGGNSSSCWVAAIFCPCTYSPRHAWAKSLSGALPSSCGSKLHLSSLKGNLFCPTLACYLFRALRALPIAIAVLCPMPSRWTSAAYSAKKQIS